MKRVVMPVRWQCAKCQRWYCGNQPCPWCWRHPDLSDAGPYLTPLTCRSNQRRKLSTQTETKGRGYSRS